MMDDALSGDRLIGMIQPTIGAEQDDRPALMGIGCAGRITAYSEMDDGRVLITLTGICRFVCQAELCSDAPYRLVVPDFHSFALDLVPDHGANEIDRTALLRALDGYLVVNERKVDWDQVNTASTEVLVNTLSLLSPYSAREKQALLEAPDLKTRTDVLIALAEMDRAHGSRNRPLQ